MTLKKLRRMTVTGDMAETDYDEWVQYPSSVAQLQKCADQVLYSQNSVALNKMSAAFRVGSPQVAAASADGNNNKANVIEVSKESEESEDEEAAKEERRQFLLSAKRNRKYVASTLFQGRFDKSNNTNGNST